MKHFGSFALDVSNQCLWKGSEQIALPPKPFSVLQYLVEHPDRLVSHEELLDALWPETYVQPQVLRTYVLDLRKALGDDARQPRYIQSLPKRGYRLVAAVDDRAHGQQTALMIAEAATPARPAGIVGREEQIEMFHRSMRKVSAAQHQVVFITGDVGIGKSALANEVVSRLRSESVTIAAGHCVQGFGVHEQYYPVMEALAQLCASPDGERACRVLARVAPAWLGLLGRESSVDRTAPEDRRPNPLCSALEELAAEKPLVLLFEDLQWADDATLHLVSAIARRTSPARLMILTTSAPHAGRAESPLRRLMQDLLVHRLGLEIALGPLSKAHVAELVRTTLDQQNLPAGLDQFVHEHSEGNPLFAIAILEHLIAQRILVRADGDPGSPWRQRVPIEQMDVGVPAQLAQMIELEIGDLSPREQCLLETASLFSVASPVWAIAAALDADAAQLEEECDLLAGRLHYVRRGGQDELPDGTASTFFVFAHGLYREVLYQRQPAARRARSHARIAERLGVLFAGREMDVAREIAMHYEAAGNWLRAADTLRAAALHAQHRNALSVAEDLMTHALCMTKNLSGAARESVEHGIRAELDALRQATRQEPISAVQKA
ncbi:MAG TPA: AAA family ATPase [Terracidiphilus sp.]|jgi:predicted ATPase/DNA-binding winged helix-turn-helix (wHTH) protein|nr:AAA family ATPase [Terracidiphilus sp.]